MDLEQNLVVVNLEEPSDVKNNCIYTAVSSAQDLTSIQCLDQPFSRLQEHLHFQPLIPQTYTQQGIVTTSTTLYENLQYSSSFIPPVVQHPLIVLTPSEMIETCETEKKHPSDDLEYYQEIQNYLVNNQLPQGYSMDYYKNLKKRAQHYLIIDNKLHHNVKQPRLVVMTKNEQNEIIEKNHIIENGIHLGIKKLVNILEEKYFWRGLYISVAKYVKNCTKCRENYKLIKNNQISSGVQTCSSVWTEVEIAIFGPFKITNSGNEYIMSIVDPVSCFILAAPINRNGHSTKLTQFLLQNFFTFGFPKTSNIVGSDLFFDAVYSEFLWRLTDYKDAKDYLKKIDKPQYLWVEELFDLLVKKYSNQWDQEIGKFLYQFRMGGIKQLANSSFCPFYAMYHRIPELFINEENKENNDINKKSCNKRKSTHMQQRGQSNEARTSEITKNNRRTKQKKMPLTDFNTPADETIVSDETIEGNVMSIKAYLAETKDVRRKRGKYQKYSAELQHEIASYSSEHGSIKASQHFTQLLKNPISESTIRSIVKSYAEFIPSLKQEIANFADVHGVDEACKHYTEKLKKHISPSLVRRFKTLYIKKIPKRTYEDIQYEKIEPFSPENFDFSTQIVDNQKIIDNNLAQFIKPECSIQSCTSFTPPVNPLCSNMSIFQNDFPHTDDHVDVDHILNPQIVLVSNDNYDNILISNKLDRNQWTEYQNEPQNTVLTPVEEKVDSNQTKVKKSKEPGRKRGRYTFYSPELRAEIGKYASEHGSLKASNHFSKVLGQDLPESTARGYKEKYLQKLKHCDVTSLGYSQRGRPVRLGKYDELVQECLKELIKSGEKVTSFLAITTAKQILNKYEPGLLKENGGNLILNTTWAKSALRRIGVHNSS